MARDNKYPDGYQPKIKYHLEQMAKSLEKKDWQKFYKSFESLNHFTIKQLYLLDESQLDSSKLNKSIER